MFFLSKLSRWWRDRGRAIYTYHDGTRRRRADPVKVHDSLEAQLPGYADGMLLLKKDSAKIPPGPIRDDLITQQRAMATALAGAARVAFDMKPLGDKDGVTDGEAIRVLIEYFLFMEDLAESATIFGNSPGTA